MTLKFTLAITQNLSQAFLEVSTAQDAKSDKTQISLRHPAYVAVGAALEQQQKAAEKKLFLNFCLISVNKF